MTRINTNLSSLTAQHILGRSQQSLQTSLTRLSTGLRINSGKDDPGGLIAGEILRSEVTSISQAIKNSERANNIVATADAALAQVSNLLNDVRGLVQASANKGAISTAEIAANQVQLDSALESIARIGQTTVFGGDKLLNGTKAFSVNATGGSLGAFASTSDITINSFDPGLHSATAGDDVTIAVTTAATRRTVVFTGTGGGGGADDLDDLTVGGTTTLELIGDTGRSVITIDNNAVIADTQAFVNAINAVTSTTGITATKAAGVNGNVTLTSAKYGSGAVLTVNAIAGAAGDIATISGSQAGTAGVNAAGTVTHSKGSGAFTAVGELITYNDASINLSAVSNPALGTLTASFDVTGGALFQIGPNVNFANQVNVNITGLDLATLGRNFSTTGDKGLSALKTGGTDVLSSSDLSTAEKLVTQAIGQIGTLRGQLGALQKNVLESNIASQQNTLEQVTAARSSIVDADFAAETANLTRSQILVQAGTSVLAIANSSPQNVLALLQR
jgi:flagellin